MRRAAEALALWLLAAASAMAAAPSCERPVYLTIDTGHMGVAEHIARVLREENVKATFFIANERTLSGGGSLDDQWAPWWRERVAEGHAFGSHTWDHDVWKADTAAGHRVKPTQGPAAGRERVLDAAAYCRELDRPAARFEQMTGQRLGSIFRAPGGKTSPALLQSAAACGYTHVGWTPAGFLGDELPSERHPNAALLQQALARVDRGDVLLVHLGIWSRRDPWAPAVLQPLIRGLKAKGLCFATLREHPRYGEAARKPRPAS
jgi:peptidoglycan-N-acetylmuramic acid deacetylase